MAYQALAVRMTQSDSGTVAFNPPFAGIPVVITTPYRHDRSAGSVSGVPTATSVTTQNVTILGSYSSDEDMGINVLAIDTGTTDINGLPVVAGSEAKTAGSLLITGTALAPSVNLLSAQFTAQVENVETLSSERDSTITVVSGNVNPSSYFVQYLSASPGTFPGAQAGIAHKGTYLLRVYFAQRWAAPPVVFVTPWYQNQVAGVETVVYVDEDYFEVRGNAGSDYYVCWIAVRGSS